MGKLNLGHSIVLKFNLPYRVEEMKKEVASLKEFQVPRGMGPASLKFEETPGPGDSSGPKSIPSLILADTHFNVGLSTTFKEEKDSNKKE